MTYFRCIFMALPLVVLLAAATGCSTAAREGAAHGATMGFVGGLAAGAVNGLLFGDSMLEGAVEGGLVGAAGGAAAGGVQGGMANKQAQASGAKQAAASGAMTEEEIEKLRKEQGDLNFQATAYLVECRHADAIAMANRALQENKKTERKVFALTLRAVAELETGREDEAEATYAAISMIDAKRSVDRARADAFQARMRVQSVRKANGIAPCGE